MKQYRFLTVVMMVVMLTTPVYAIQAQTTDTASDATIVELNTKISTNKEKIKSLQDQIKIYETNIRQKQSEAASLRNQLSVLEDQISLLETTILRLDVELETVGTDIILTETEIEKKIAEMNQQRGRLGELVQLHFRLQQRSPLQILIGEQSLSAFFNQLKYSQSVQDSVQQTLAQIEAIKERLELKKKELAEKQAELEKLKKDKLDTQAVLEGQSDLKSQLLVDTRNTEAKFQSLLKSVREQESATNADIVSTQKAINARLQELRLDQLGGGAFVWPVNSRRVTTNFMDPGYIFKKYFEHAAIDIAARYGSPVMAAQDGYVAIAKDAGLGYSYIMVIHRDGLSTVYGHVSKIFVKVGEYVKQGQQIGNVGGLPGTPGAGRFSTGAHVHFETRLNGLPVNPLNYLP